MNTVSGHNEESTQESFDFVTNLYHDDLNSYQLRVHLDILKATFPTQLKSPQLSFQDVRKYIQNLSEAERSFINDVQCSYAVEAYQRCQRVVF